MGQGLSGELTSCIVSRYNYSSRRLSQPPTLAHPLIPSHKLSAGSSPDPRFGSMFFCHIKGNFPSLLLWFIFQLPVSSYSYVSYPTMSLWSQWDCSLASSYRPVIPIVHFPSCIHLCTATLDRLHLCWFPRNNMSTFPIMLSCMHILICMHNLSTLFSWLLLLS